MIRQCVTCPADWIEAEPRPRRWAPLTLGLALGAVLGVGLTAWTDGVADLEVLRGSAADTRELAAQEWPSRPLPREWRWSPPTVKVDHMFRKER